MPLDLPPNPTQERTEFTIQASMQKYWPPLSFTLDRYVLLCWCNLEYLCSVINVLL